VIAPNFNAPIGDAHGLGAREQRKKPRSLHVHLHVPERLTDAVMQFLATFSGGSSVDSCVTRPRSNSLFDWEPEAIEPDVLPAQPAPIPAGQSDASECRPAPGSLLRAYQDRLKEKRKRSASADTIGDHESSMRAFDRFCAERQGPEGGSQTLHRLYTPVQCLGETDVLRLFSEYLVRSGLSPATVNRRLTHMAMIAKELKVEIDKPTPDEVKRFRHSLIPAETPPESFSDVRRIPSFSELDALARHVTAAKYPYGEHAPYFWRGWIRFLAFIGPRSRDVVSVLRRKTGLKKQDVIWDTLCPIADVNNALGYELHSPHGWLWYTIGKDHHSDCRRILIPMPQWMRGWVRFFCEFSHHPERVFPSCQRHSQALSQDKVTEAWLSIVSAAGVDPRLCPSEGSGGSIAIRKFAANWWQLTTLKAKHDAALADKMSHYVLHHKEVTTATKHYLNVQAAVLPVMLELMQSWPIPAADALPVSMLPE